MCTSSRDEVGVGKHTFFQWLLGQETLLTKRLTIMTPANMFSAASESEQLSCASCIPRRRARWQIASRPVHLFRSQDKVHCPTVCKDILPRDPSLVPVFAVDL